ncbi:hypothetical protein [Halalkalibacter krulwichiae]|uniref:Phage-related minor tail protein n=1 Tax=Halalkalibacter krulwichiae TaxID=199441 RepID=A0A1X9MEI0_9BACI|nr:hypothetical protein [Halalkalibacter krulwichiae]ARK31847.1 hypothetical protein BkAM31D_19520 [Halalkalibacter krulwichiae]
MSDISFAISAIDNFSKPLDDLSSKVESLSSKAENFGNKVADVGGGMTKWVSGPIAAAGVAAFGLATKVGNTADRILDLRDITGMSTDSIQEWQHVAKIAGVETEAVTHATEGLVRRLPQIAKEGGPAYEAIEKLGYSAEDLSNMTPDDMIDSLIGSLAGMEDPLERNALGSQIFGGAWKDMAPILGMGEDAINDLRGEAHELGGVMDGDALNAANEFRQSMVRLQTQAMAFANEIGAKVAPILTDVLIPAFQDHLLPILQSVGDKVMELIDWFAALSPEGQKTALMIVGIVAAIGPALVIIGKLIGAVKLAGVAFTVLTGPIGLGIAAVAAFVAIGWVVYKNWGEIIGWINEKFPFMGKVIESAMEAIRNIISIVWKYVKDTFSNTLDFLKALVRGDFQGMKDSVSKQMTLARGAISRIWSEIKAHFGRVLDEIWSNVKEKFEDMVSSVREKMGNVKTTISEIWGEVQAFFAGIDLYQIGRDIVQGLINGITGMGGTLKRKVTSFIDENVPAPIKKLLGIASPSKLMEQYGNWTGEGFTIGMEDAIPDVSGISKQLATASVPEIPNRRERYITQTQPQPVTASQSERPIHLQIDLDGETVARKVFNPMDNMLGQSMRQASYMSGVR